MRSLTLLAALAGSASAQELMRFGCSQLTIDRIDPLVNPGQLPSSHMHQVIGGQSFNASMTPVTLDPSSASSCTSCTYSEDFSNYWTANVYFKAKNGTYKRVPQVAKLGLRVQGGMTVYYIRGYQAAAKVTAFPKVRLPVSFPVPGPASPTERRRGQGGFVEDVPRRTRPLTTTTRASACSSATRRTATRPRCRAGRASGARPTCSRTRSAEPPARAPT